MHECVYSTHPLRKEPRQGYVILVVVTSEVHIQDSEPLELCSTVCNYSCLMEDYTMPCVNHKYYHDTCIHNYYNIV